MTVKYVAPTYSTAKEYVLFAKAYGSGQYLDITVQPIRPGVGSLPCEVEKALESVILKVRDPREDVEIIELLESLNSLDDSERAQAAFLEAVAKRIISRSPELEGDERTVYVCPIIADGGVGHKRGFVVAWNKEDAFTVAEYMAGGRADLYLDHIERDDELLCTARLGDLSYSDITGQTDTYQRILEGKAFAGAMAWHLGIKDHEPEDPERPGAEFFKYFRNLV